ncbi:unnamed protein product [Miscanthus lutarioriparius]|uniref:Uncharacterized protein n=1 Tax=Miscanthus lutarioriparius TaxID=422564 RepID=A0A811QQQ6_9POAL|nr:unnamed protein product [Miscanthus lutarioriparius]
MPPMAASGKAGHRATDYGGVEAAGRKPKGAGVSGRLAWSSRGASLGHGARPLARPRCGDREGPRRGSHCRRPGARAPQTWVLMRWPEAKADSMSAPIAAAQSTGLCAADCMCVCMVQSARAARSGCHGARRCWSGAMVGITNLVDAGEEEAGERHLPLHRRLQYVVFHGGNGSVAALLGRLGLA